MPFDLASATPASQAPQGGFDLASAKPAAPPKAGTGAPEESPYSLGNLAGAAVEPMLSMATGGVGAVAGGLGGIGAGINKALGFSDREPGDVTRSISSGMTYEPKTSGGKTAMGAIGYPFQKFGEFSEEAGGKTTEMLTKAGAPPSLAAGVGAAGNAALQFLPQLLASRGAGAAAEKAPTGIPKMLPEPSPSAELMMKKGVTLTPGQLFGGEWNKVEQAISKWPIVGGPIRGARGRSFDQMNAAAYNDVLEPIKGKMPEGMVGHEAIARLQDTLGDRYDSILAKTKGRLDNETPPAVPQLPGAGGIGAPPQPAAPSLRGELTSLRDLMEASTLPKKYKKEFGRIVDEDIIARFQDTGLAGGETLKDIQSGLRSIYQAKGRSDNRDVRAQGLAIKEAGAAVRRMIERENPEYAPQLQATDAAYAKFKIVQKAAAAAGKNGVFTPAQFERAVRAKDPTKDKSAFAKGMANEQEFAAAAKEILGDLIPDSGTPSQFLIAALFSREGRQILGLPGGLAAAGLLAPFYSKTGLGMTQKMLTGPPTSGVPAARGLPFGAAAAGNQIDAPPQ